MAFIDPFSRENAHSLGDPANDMFEITPDDDNDIQMGVKALRIFNPTGSFGTIRVLTLGGSDVTLPIPQGVWPESVRVSRVFETGTTVGLTIHGYTVADITYEA